MFFGNREDKARRMHDQALAALEKGELDEARAIAGELIAMQWSGGFEVEALAARAEGDLQEAVRVLERGVAAAPEAWALHQLLGITRGVLGEGERAIAAFDRALVCPEVWAASVRYNRAVARMKRDDVGGALADAEAVLEDPTSVPFVLDALAVALDALDKLRRREDAISLVETLLGTVPPDDIPARSDLQAFLALAMARAGRDENSIRELVIQAIDGGSARPELLFALRHGATKSAEALWRVVIQGPIEAVVRESERELRGYLRVVFVRADSEEQARQLAVTLEPSSHRDEVSIEDCNLEERTSGVFGIEHASGRVFFGDEA